VPSIESWIQAYEYQAGENQQRLHALERLYKRFQNLGVEILPVKGMDLLLRAYPDLGRRPMSDIDLLIHPEDLSRALSTLAEEGFHRVPAENVVRQSFVEDSIACISAETLLVVDLHWGFGFLQDSHPLWQRRVLRSTRLGNCKLLHPEDSLLILIAYAVTHRGRLSPLWAQDIETLLQQEAQNISWDAWVAHVRQLNLSVPLAHGLAYAQSQGVEGIPAEVLQSLRPRTVKERALAQFYRRMVTESQPPEIRYLFQWVTTPTRAAKRQLLGRSFFPSRALAEQRLGGPVHRVSHLRSWLIRPLRLSARGLYFLTKDLWHLIKTSPK
jgi:hypothetical protein